MCFNKTTSITTFVLGTIVNIVVAVSLINHGYSDLAWRLAIVVGWQYALLMQIPEAVQWHYIDQGLRAPASTERAAYWLNTLQPLAAALLIGSVSFAVNGVAVPPAMWVAVFATALFTLSAMMHADESLGRREERMAPEVGCDHLNLHWWEVDSLLPYFPLYLIAMFATVMALPTPSLRAVQSSWYFGTLLLSRGLYSCGGASIWCWFVAMAGLTTLIP
jgi:hypothetical protein